MKNILIPFDFSKASFNALDYAVKFAGQDSSIHLHLLHIKDESILENNILEKLNEVVKKYENPLNPQLHTLLRSGELISTIIQIQQQLEVDLIIMGTRGADLDEEDLVTVTSRFVHEADLPVLVIPEKFKYLRLNTIILSIGQDEITDRSPLYLLLKVSRKFNAKVHVLTVQKTPVAVAYSEVDESNESTLQYYLENFYSHHSFSENEDIEKGILDYIEKYEIDMVAIMPNNHHKDGMASEGRLTRFLSLHTNVPLLVLD